MEIAIEQAHKGNESGQYPIGSVVVREGHILAASHTTLSGSSDPTAHAELNSLRIAAALVGDRYLPGAWLYSTHEPCPMCAAGAIWAKLSGIVFGTYIEDVLGGLLDARTPGPNWRQIRIHTREVASRIEYNPPLVVEGFMRDECLQVLRLDPRK